MTLNELLDIVHSAYPDGATRECWDAERGRASSGSGDTLAEFVVKEIADTYGAQNTDTEQLSEAVRVMERACGDIGDVIEALQSEFLKRKDTPHANRDRFK